MVKFEGEHLKFKNKFYLCVMITSIVIGTHKSRKNFAVDLYCPGLVCIS